MGVGFDSKRLTVDHDPVVFSRPRFEGRGGKPALSAQQYSLMTETKAVSSLIPDSKNRSEEHTSELQSQ